MKETMQRTIRKLWGIYEGFFGNLDRNHLKAYAAESSFFLVISLVPGILLLLTLIQFTPVTEADVILAAQEIFPTDINLLITTIVEEVYSKSTTVISITAITTLWSAGKGVLSIVSGLNWIFHIDNKKNYIYTRIRATIYTLFFVIAIVLTLVILVFGNKIGYFVVLNMPVFHHIIDLIIQIRVLGFLGFLILIFMIAYKVLPSEKNHIRNQFPGALFAALGWILCSFAFSIYVDVYDGFANMYGSLTTIVLIMLWLYFCMYSMLIGARMNVYLAESRKVLGDRE